MVCTVLRAAWTKIAGAAQEERLKVAKVIFNKYIAEDAPMPINLPGPERKRIGTKVNEVAIPPHMPSDLFDTLLSMAVKDLNKVRSMCWRACDNALTALAHCALRTYYRASSRAPISKTTSASR